MSIRWVSVVILKFNPPELILVPNWSPHLLLAEVATDPTVPSGATLDSGAVLLQASEQLHNTHS